MPNTSQNDLPAKLGTESFRLLFSAARSRFSVSALAILAVLAAGVCDMRIAAAAPDHPQSQTMQPVLPSFSALVERVAPAVVSIRVKANPAAMTTREDAEDEGAQSSEKDNRKDNPFEGTPLERFFDGPNAPGPQQRNSRRSAVPPPPVQGQGSGFFISADGYIVTNHHVVDGAIKVEIVSESGEILEAKIIGTDPGADLALLKVEGSTPFPFVPLGHSEAKPGDWVIAIGNPFGLGGTVTAGIVSARGRDIGLGAYDNFLQIDAPVNKGNSGGPAFNQAGEVIGVNTAIFSPSGGSAGIAFAIPAKTVENVVSQLKSKGRVTRSWLGVQVQAVTPELADSLGLKAAQGALVSVPTPGSPADAAGIRRGDVILRIGGEDIKDGRDLARKVASAAPGVPVKIAIERTGKREILEAKLTELGAEAKPELPPHDLSQQTEITSIGVNVVPAEDGKGGTAKGLAVLDVNPNGKGADAGLLQGDIILNANGADISKAADLEAALKSAAASGKKHALAFVQRGTTQVYLALPAGEG
ncbi:MAG: Do family serine endopeptidase [Rhodomicrobium sp.]